MLNLNASIYALLGGVLPALVWLWFWLREDTRDPEPRILIIKTFLFGMVAVILVLPFQKIVNHLLPGAGALAFLLWAILEETFKFAAAYYGGLSSKEDNEPIDPIIYMITAALGFVALENALFILAPVANSDWVSSVLTSNMRFIGANLLHIVASGLVGAALAVSFYKTEELRIELVLGALTIASLFHMAFNLLIMGQTNFGAVTALSMVWVSVAALLILFEKAKSIAP
jgi:protease PrsW